MSAAATASYDSASDVPAGEVDALLAALRPRYAEYGQEHVFAFVAELSTREKQELYFDLQHIQVENTGRDFQDVIKQEEGQPMGGELAISSCRFARLREAQLLVVVVSPSPAVRREECFTRQYHSLPQCVGSCDDFI
jgi:hypothetical protein